MKAAREMLVGLGGPALMTAAIIAHLERLLTEGMPEIRLSSPSPEA
jgi:hypothetical protein